MTRAHARAEGRRRVSEVTKIAWTWGDVGHTAKNFFVGEPTKFYKQLRAGTAAKPRGLLHDVFVPRTLGQGLLSYGLPLGLGYMGMQAVPQEQKGRGWGSMIGGTAGAMALSPLGFAGQTVGGMLGGQLGEQIGSVFDPKQG